MRDIDYIVTGFPRSGTTYAAHVLSKLGLNCGHEKAFSHNKSIMAKDTDELWGDSSWLAAPFLDRLPETTLRFIQRRNPYKVLDSVFPGGKGSLVGTLSQVTGKREGRKGPYARFATRWCADYVTADDEMERICQWYLRWHEYTNVSATWQYKVEDMASELSWIRHLIDGEPQHDDGIEEALNSVPTNTNSRGEPRHWSADYIQSATNDTVKLLEDVIGGLGYELD
jgi:hypothetical protein